MDILLVNSYVTNPHYIASTENRRTEKGEPKNNNSGKMQNRKMQDH